MGADGPSTSDDAGKEDEALIVRYRDCGDVAALDTLVRRHTNAVLGYLRGMLGGSADLDDLFQEVWLRVIRHSDGYRSRNVRGWIFRIAHNVVIDRYRRQRNCVSLDAPNAEGGSLVDTLPGRGDSPLRQVETQDALARLDRLIRELPESQRTVFLMRAVGELSFKEIARILRIPVNTALGRMHYAVMRLRPAISDGMAGWMDKGAL